MTQSPAQNVQLYSFISCWTKLHTPHSHPCGHASAPTILHPEGSKAPFAVSRYRSPGVTEKDGALASSAAPPPWPGFRSWSHGSTWMWGRWERGPDQTREAATWRLGFWFGWPVRHQQHHLSAAGSRLFVSAAGVVDRAGGCFESNYLTLLHSQNAWPASQHR